MTDPAVPSSDSELRAFVERALGAHYELDCEIGRGGMGIVYRARDRRLKRVVAIKVLPPELAFRSEIKVRFLREAETAAQLNHPNIVDIYSVDELQQLVFFVMAYIPGDNLAKRLHDGGAMSVDDTRRIVRDVADALAYAHERGVVHRDIKPDNILIDEDSGRPMVTDFGIARAITEGDNRLTATGIAIGTPTYMSPEQAAGDRQIDGRSDLYALGIVAYQMLTGQPPFTASSTPAMLVKHLSERPAPIEQRRGDVPQDLARAVMTLLEKDPAARFPSASALVHALDDAPRSGGRPSRSSGLLDGGSSAIVFGNVQSPVPAGGFGIKIELPKASEFGDRGSFTGQQPMPASALEEGRWNHPAVVDFRRKVAPYIYVNGVILLMQAFTRVDLGFFTVIWTIYMSWKYAKLWSHGYDWRDVFRQPREREIVDVVEDSVGYVKVMFDSEKRAQHRTERQTRAVAMRNSSAIPAPAAGAFGEQQPFAALPAQPAPGGGSAATTESARDLAMRAMANRDEIIRILRSLSPADRARVPDVSKSAQKLAASVQALTASLRDIDRSSGGTSTSLEAIEAEIARLENDANPLDLAGSETRVKRLAFLKRQRRGMSDVSDRRRQIAGKLETCASALETMKYDLLRLSAGAGTHQRVTSLAMEAISLAESVDHALAAADEVSRLTSDRPARAT